MYPRIDILRISAILTDTDRTRIVISLLERIRIRILCHEYSTDTHYALMLFCLNIILCIVYITRHTGHRHKMQLQVIELSNTEYRVIDASLMFWKDNCKQFPKLGCVARSVFACLAASSASERAFSKAGAIYSKRRGGNMKPSTLEALCFLQCCEGTPGG